MYDGSNSETAESSSMRRGEFRHPGDLKEATGAGSDGCDDRVAGGESGAGPPTDGEGSRCFVARIDLAEDFLSGTSLTLGDLFRYFSWGTGEEV